jgi:uncharacterized protein involved in type VI secretion and phage assembly
VVAKRKIVSTVPAGTKSVDLPTMKPADMAKPFGSPRYVASDRAFRTQSEADAAAKALAEEIGSSFAEIDAVARGNPKLRANVGIKIENAGEPFDGKYTVTAARHRFEPTNGGYTTSFAVTGRQERSLYGLTGGSGRAGTGIVIAQVSDVNDPTHQGRVKLTFPWLSDDYVSDWARTVQPGAGKDRGSMFLPEVGDEVLVAFEQHDALRPYVLGGLFNGVDTPMDKGTTLIDANSGAVNRRSLISRNGHRIDLLDEDGKTEGITAETADGKLKLTLDSVGTSITVHSDGTVLVEGKRGIVIDAASSNLELKGRKISVTATNGVDVSGGAGAVNVEAGTALSLKGTSASVNGKAKAELTAGGETVVRGAMVRIN